MEASEAKADRRPDEAGETDRLRRELEDEQQRHVRLRADFENYRRRVSREMESARLTGKREALLPLLAVLDTLERALAMGSSDAGFLEGVAATRRQFLTALREAGAVPIDSVGRPFDPELHEIVATEAADGVEPGTVSRDLRKGWRIDDDLLRPAQVVVTRAAEPDPDNPWR